MLNISKYLEKFKKNIEKGEYLIESIADGKIYVIELLKNDAYIAQFNTELEFELRSEATISQRSIIQVIGDEVIVTAAEKKGTKDDVKVFKVKDLSFVK
jgi:hypothetical protein